ncbi:GntR family transcriptional regulator [Enterococcus ureilyticus]|uniref:GntR family transcriptional regulator n=1 Tax=Enterococcus ureilyticus TaxID=1131292 RepID=UPI001A910076|nr:GntR family transcriptional regulator [Enterococcus ureilyticus]MBO0445894.1 GntR family transcriptional regulator [Enterococcus ureilyticus]
MQVNYDSNRPIYQQIIEQVEQWIINGHWQQNEKVPSVRQLAEDLAVNPTTVQRAYSILEQEEILISQRGIGKFVTHNVGKIKDLRFRLIEAHLKTFLTKLQKLELTQNEREHIIERIVRTANE